MNVPKFVAVHKLASPPTGSQSIVAEKTTVFAIPPIIGSPPIPLRFSVCVLFSDIVKRIAKSSLTLGFGPTSAVIVVKVFVNLSLFSEFFGTGFGPTTSVKISFLVLETFATTVG